MAQSSSLYTLKSLQNVKNIFVNNFMSRLSLEHAQFSLSLESSCFLVYLQVKYMVEQSTNFISAAWKKM